MDYEEYLCTYDIEGGCDLFATMLVEDKMYCAYHGVGDTVTNMVDKAIDGMVSLVVLWVCTRIVFGVLRILRRILLK